MYILSLCDVEEVQQILGIVKMIVDFIKIIVPIILMVSAMITLMLDIKAGNEDALAKSKKLLINKAIAAALIFFVPTLVDLVLNLAAGETEYKKCFNVSSAAPTNETSINNASTYLTSAESSLDRKDYNKAYDSINKLEDETLKNEYLSRLEKLDELIKENEKTSKTTRTTRRITTNNGGYGNNSGNITRTTRRNTTTKRTTTKASNKQVAGSYYLGDSRTVGMSSTLDSNEKSIAKVGGNYTDFITHSSSLKNELYNKTDSYNIVLNYGVNDLYNSSKYCTGYKDLASSLGSNYKIYVVSVNPVDDSKGWNATNKEINSFNSSIKSCISGVSNMKYCDVSSKATTSACKNYLSDGLHYTNDGYKFIHSKIKECMK
mgnify:FL=1